MTEEAFRESIRNMRNHESQLEHAGDYWTDSDRERLKSMFDEGVGISEIAIRLQRTEPAVCQQIEKLDLYQRKDRPRRRKLPAQPCGCHCKTCEVDHNDCPRYLEQLKEEEADSDAGTV